MLDPKMQSPGRASCYGQVAILRLTVLALAGFVVLLLCNRPEVSRLSLANIAATTKGSGNAGAAVPDFVPYQEEPAAEKNPTIEVEPITEEVPTIEAEPSAEEETTAEEEPKYSGDASPGILAEHPIQTLSRNAASQFEDMLHRQSKTYEEAEAEYRRRYKRSPPPGFQQWYEYAKAENSLIIDEFDVIDRAISPFLQYSGAEISANVAQLANESAWSWTCKIHNGRLSKSCEILGEEFMILLADVRILAHLPDVEFVINGLDEPRILLNQAATPDSTAQKRRTRRSEDQSIEWREFSNKNAWKELAVDRCDGFRHAGSASNEIETLDLPFIQNISNAMDICQHPEYEHLHGFWESPTSLQVTDSPVPMLAPAALSTMNDILFPAIAYTQGMYAYSESEILDYDKKTPGLYWAGKTTGGYLQMDHNNDSSSLDTDHDPSRKDQDYWLPFHRQRFVSLANDLLPESHTYLSRDDPENPTSWKSISHDHLNSTSYHVHFTGIVQCDDTACAYQKNFFHIPLQPDSRAEGGKHTLVFDTDGNGHSARYYRLLESKSLPLKQTVFREWHDERLAPWVHYVPISLGLDELPEVVRYLVEEEEGRLLARELALKGREWALSVLRPVDQVVYMFRLLLELARLGDPERRAGEVE